MRRLLAPLSRWLDRRIDARIARETQGLRLSNDVLWNRISLLEGLRPPVPEHSGLVEMAATGIRDAAAVQKENRDLGRHGLSLEWIELGGSAATGGMLDDLPPVGSSFVQVVAAENGFILLSSGTPLPDNHVRYGAVTRMAPEAARSVATALVRAADLTSDAPSSGQPQHEERSVERSRHLHHASATRGAR